MANEPASAPSNDDRFHEPEEFLRRRGARGPKPDLNWKNLTWPNLPACESLPALGDDASRRAWLIRAIVPALNWLDWAQNEARVCQGALVAPDIDPDFTVGMPEVIRDLLHDAWLLLRILRDQGGLADYGPMPSGDVSAAELVEVLDRMMQTLQATLVGLTADDPPQADDRFTPNWNDRLILRAMAALNCAATHAEIAYDVCAMQTRDGKRKERIAERTVATRLKRLIAAGLAVQRNGSKGGTSITAAGRDWL